MSPSSNFLALQIPITSDGTLSQEIKRIVTATAATSRLYTIWKSKISYKFIIIKWYMYQVCDRHWRSEPSNLPVFRRSQEQLCVDDVNPICCWRPQDRKTKQRSNFQWLKISASSPLLMKNITILQFVASPTKHITF